MTDALGVRGESEALRAVEANRSPRYKKLDQLERFVETTQYEGKPSWYDDDSPLWDRAPCIAYPIVKTAIASNVDMLLGEQSFPAVTAFSHSNDDEELEDEALAERLATVDRGISELIQKARLKAAARESYAQAQGSRTAAAILGCRNGRLFIDTVRAKWCTPEIDSDGNVISVEIRYAYVDRERDEQGIWHAVAKLFRRVIDGKRDVTFKPELARLDGLDPKSWTEDKALSVSHGLGFCPVIWYAYRKGCSLVNEIDGQAVHEHCLDEIVAHDFAISSRHSAALFVGQPQICEFGVPPGYNPTEEGSKPDLGAHRENASGIGMQSGAVERVGEWIDGRAAKGGARKKGPGYIWQYPDKQTCDVKMLEISEGSLKAIDEHASDIRAKIAESLQVVFLDPEHVKFAASVSGKALRTLRERQYAHCDQDREDFGEGWLMPVVKMLLRIVLKVGVGKVKLRFAAELLKALKTLAAEQANAAVSSAPTDSVDDFDIPDLDLKWPDHFMPSPEEELFTVQATEQATVIPDRIKIQKLARVFDIENVDVVLEELAKQKLEAQQHELDMQSQLATTLRDGSPGPAQGAGPVGAKKPAPGGSGTRPGGAVAASGST